MVMREKVVDYARKVFVEEIEPKVPHFEGDVFEPLNGTGDAGVWYGVSDYIGQNQ